jgi:hypothetical protein
MPTEPQLRPALRVGKLTLPALLVPTLGAVALFAGLGAGIQQWYGSLGLTRSVHQAARTPHTASAPADTILTINPTQPGREFAPGAVGLSIEASTLSSPTPSAGRRQLVQLMRLLGPGVLRVGGNTLDYSWWTSSGEQPPEWARSVVTPADLTRLRALLSATDWQVILGVDLGHFEPARAAGEARIAQLILGRRLLGIEIGNEPNGYRTPAIGFRSSTYDANTYLGELSAYSAAIHIAAPTISLYGPDLSTPTSWLTTIASDSQAPFATFTEHYYPAQFVTSHDICQSVPVPATSELLSSQVREQENTVLTDLLDAGHLAHRDTRISETNTTPSCHGAVGYATNPVFASALWSLDWTLRAASAGVSGLNFHGSFGQCTEGSFSPICAPGHIAAVHGLAAARPEYYGLFAARQLEGGHFIPVRLSGPASAAYLTAYATETPHHRLTLAIDNFSTTTPAVLSIDAATYRRATYERLTAPSIGSTGDVSFGHASFDALGKLSPKPARIAWIHGSFQVYLPPTSAMIVRLRK